MSDILRRKRLRRVTVLAVTVFIIVGMAAFTALKHLAV